MIPALMNPLEAAVATVLATTDVRMLAALASTPHADLPEMHVYLGARIRALVGLWEGSTPIAQHFRGKGVQHPDDMSLDILSAVWTQLRCERLAGGRN